MIQDSGTRREFETGAVRDIAEGKGRCDLLPLYEVGECFPETEENYEPKQIMYHIDSYVRNGNLLDLFWAIELFVERHFENTPNAMLEVAIHFEEGCKKYGERNFENGIPLHCYIDSAVRHYLKFLRGDDDERHDRAFLWNLLCCLWTQRNKPEMNDLPFAEKEN